MPKSKKLQKKQLAQKQAKDKSKCYVLCKKIALFGVIFAVISLLIHIIGAILEMDYYINPAYFAIWSKIMMPGAGAPGIWFYVVSLLFSFISGAIFAWVYTVIKRGVPFKGIVRGIIYSLLVFLVATIPGDLSMILLLAVPYMLILYWTIECLVTYVIMGAILGKMFK